MHRLEIKCPEGEIAHDKNIKVLLDGKPFNIYSIELKVAVDELCTVKVEMDVSLDMDIGIGNLVGPIKLQTQAP